MYYVKEIIKLTGMLIQIYSDESAFNKHVNSPGYRFMMSQIQGNLQNVTTKVLDGDILVNHGGSSVCKTLKL